MDNHYRVGGYVKLAKLWDRSREAALAFHKEAIMFEPNKEEYIDPTTGEIKKRQITYYPDYYKGRIGRSYNDYNRARQLSLFENLDTFSNADEPENAASHGGVQAVGSSEESVGESQATSTGEPGNPVTGITEPDQKVRDEYAGYAGIPIEDQSV